MQSKGEFKKTPCYHRGVAIVHAQTHAYSRSRGEDLAAAFLAAPMKRHPQLIELSREHHAALSLAVHARRAAAGGDAATIDALVARCRAAFAAELEPHFAVEEKDLLPRLRDAGKNELAARLVRDHAALRELSAELAGRDAAKLAAFGELLAEHVRFEERELFVALEALLDS